MFEIPEKITHIRVGHYAKRANGPAPYHQIVLPDGVWLNVFENGQITVNTKRNDISVTGVRNHTTGSNLSILVSPKVAGDPDTEADEETEERIEVLDLPYHGEA